MLRTFIVKVSVGYFPLSIINQYHFGMPVSCVRSYVRPIGICGSSIVFNLYLCSRVIKISLT